MAPESSPNHDLAALYVLDELDPIARHDFEAQLADSPELRAALRQTEEAAIAAALSAPAIAAPPSIWPKIETAISREEKKVIPLFSNFWRNGWAAAAACALGWILYALFTYRPVPTENHPPIATHDARPNLNPAPENVSPQTTNLAFHPKDPSRENQILRDQLVGLQRQVTQLSHSFTQQQVLLNDPSRLKFMKILPANDGTTSAPPSSLSPLMQRALFLAMARELGWTSPTNLPALPPLASTNKSNVEFVDFRPEAIATNAPPPPPPPKENQILLAESSGAPTTDPLPAVVFTSGENAVVVVETSSMPAGTELAVYTDTGELVSRTWTTSASGAFVITVPNSPTGATIHFQAAGSGHGVLYFQAVP